MPAAILALLTALPELLKLIEQIGPEIGNLVKGLITWINHVSGNDPQGFAVKLGAAFSQLEQAKTPEDKQASAKAIADMIRGLP